MIITILLTLSILAGQLIKLPLANNLGPTMLDFVILLFSIFGLFKYQFKFKTIPLFVKAGLIFILITVISLIFTPLHLILQQYLISSSYIIRFSLYFIFGWFIYAGAFPQIKKNLEKILLYSGLGLAILGLLQFIFIPDLGFLQAQGWDPHILRTFSTFLDPNFLGAYLTLSFVLILSQFNFPVKFSKKLIISLLIYIALLTTFSRSSYLDFLISGLILGILKKSWVLNLIVIILFVGLLGGFQVYTILVSTPRNINRTYSADARLNTWQQGITMFKNNPILGVGFNTYRYALTQEGLADETFVSQRGGSSNDSSLLSILATTGIVGIISYLILIFSLLKGEISIAILSGLLIHSIFNNTLFYPHIMLWIFLLPALATNFDKEY